MGNIADMPFWCWEKSDSMATVYTRGRVKPVPLVCVVDCERTSKSEKNVFDSAINKKKRVLNK